MIESVEIHEPLGLEDYSAQIPLWEPTRLLMDEAESLVSTLRNRRVWMVNSTAQGGGVAEMMPKLVSLMRELGVDTEWIVMSARRPDFFVLTKKLHNLIHGEGDPKLGPDDLALYEAESRENAELLRKRLSPDDLLVIHDPQPLGMGAILKESVGLPMIFRCHIGLDEDKPQTRAAWEFLKPFAEHCDHAVFSAPEYIPSFLAGRSSLIYPAIDPLSYKNRELSPQKLMGVLCNARLAPEEHPVVPQPYEHTAKRLDAEGNFVPADRDGGIGLLYRPIITQVSRWDRLKGFKPLLDGFVKMKMQLVSGRGSFLERHRRRLEVVRLLLAGPDPAAIADDPEGREVLDELIESYKSLPSRIQSDIAVVSLPMESRQQNELMVNAIQRSSSIVVQNSLREGFGLTVTEAMWKRATVLGSGACGIRQQIRDGVDGRLIHDPEDPAAIAELLDRTLDDLPTRDRLGQNAQRRVHSEFLVFTQTRRWLEVLSKCAEISEKPDEERGEVR
jgi:trehalose synthase